MIPTTQPTASELQDLSAHLWLSGNTAQSLKVADRALKLRRTVPTCINMAVILETLGRYDEALIYSQMAYETDPSDPRAAQGLGEALLRMGRFHEGWSLYCYERRDLRWLCAQIPEWKGQSLDGKRLLLLSYGGFGDNFYFLHAVPFLKNLGARVFYACHQPLASLARYIGCTPITAPSDSDTISLKGYDYFLPIYAVGWRLGWSLDNPLWRGPYVRLPFWNRLRSWPYAGICWQAGEKTSPRKTRFLSASQVSEIKLAYGHDMVDFTGLSGDWLPTVKRLAKLSLLITVDTGLAHLAGAMSIPTWTLLPGGAAWHYPLGHDYHPFYPSMRLLWNDGEGLDSAVLSCIRLLKELQ